MEYLNVRTMEKSKGPIPSDLSPQTAQPQSNVQEQEYTISQDSDISVPENVILQTKNYAMFKLDSLNREIRQDKLDRLFDAVQAKNLLHLFPIVVTRKLTIVDGQHRFRVAEALNTEIYYIVSSQMQIEDAAHVNSNTDNWKMSDYLHHWCGVGLPGYLHFRDFYAAHQWMSMSIAAGLCFRGDVSGKARGDNKGISRLFASGQYAPNDMAFAEKVCIMAKDFSTWVGFWKEATFLHVMRNLASNTDYEHGRMMMKMQYQSSKLVKCPNVESYIVVMNEIYNFKVPDSRKVTLRKLGTSSPKYRPDISPE